MQMKEKEENPPGTAALCVRLIRLIVTVTSAEVDRILQFKHMKFIFQ